jgi:predicted methyltransferase
MFRISWLAVAVLAAVLTGAAGCASRVDTRDKTADKRAADATASEAASTAAELDRILLSEHRSEQNRARDVYRHPKETLLFFGIRPQMNVVEVWPEPGWYTEVIAPLLAMGGRYYAAEPAPDPASPYMSAQLKAYQEKIAARPDLYGSVVFTTFGPDSNEIAPPGSADLVVTFRNIHNWMAEGWAPQAFASMYRALKPGGVLGVVEHRGKPGVPQDPQAKSGYVDEDYAIALIQGAGFKLVAKSEINANPKDTKDYEQGVWTLPPVYRLGKKDREKYAQIGESDRFTLKFVKSP